MHNSSKWENLSIRTRRYLIFDYWGLFFGAIMYFLALTPSLLPRTWVWQGIACGLSSATGYGIGVLLYSLWRRFNIKFDIYVNSRIQSKPRIQLAIYIAVIIATLIWVITSTVWALRWQREIADLTGAKPYDVWEFLRVPPVALIIWFSFVILFRGIIATEDLLVRKSPKSWYLPLRKLLAWFVVGTCMVIIVESIIPNAIVGVAERVFSVENSTIDPKLSKPTAPERSGSEESLNNWEGLGKYGTEFVANGLNAQELTEVTGREAKEPIRVYTGIKHEKTVSERAERTVKELERTGAQDRKILVVSAATGTGWINPTFAQAVELLFDGDTAIASVQYSYLPSALQAFSSQEPVQEAGRELIIAVVNWWKKLPPDHRPKIYLFGESLGTSASEASFLEAFDTTEAISGAFWVGPINTNKLWNRITTGRDPGSREVEPVFEGGKRLRVAERVSSIPKVHSPEWNVWGDKRILIVQHPSDPVVWWSPKLIFRQPDWLKEEPGFDRSPSMFWMPFVTFFQISADLPNAGNIADGHGHNYRDSFLEGFAAVTGDQRFDEQYLKTAKEQLHQAMNK